MDTDDTVPPDEQLLALPWSVEQHDPILVGRYDLYYVRDARPAQIISGLSRPYAEALVRRVNGNLNQEHT